MASRLSRAGEPFARGEILRPAHGSCRTHEGLVTAVRPGLFQLITHELALRHAGFRCCRFQPSRQFFAQSNSNSETHMAEVFTSKPSPARTHPSCRQLDSLARRNSFRSRRSVYPLVWCLTARTPEGCWPVARGPRSSRSRAAAAARHALGRRCRWRGDSPSSRTHRC